MKKIGVKECILCKSVVSFYIKDDKKNSGIVEMPCTKCNTMNHMDITNYNINKGDFVDLINESMFSQKQIDNFTILELLTEYVRKYPYMRFHQMLSHINATSDEDLFYEESGETLSKIIKSREEEIW